MQYPVFQGDISNISLSDSRQIIQTINAYSYIMAERLPEFKRALQNANILIADGFPIVLTAKLLKNKKITKIAGADLFFHLMKIANENSSRIFFIGSTDSTLGKIKKKISIEYMNITCGFYSPPYKSIFSEDDSELMLSKINEFKADIVFVGMTAPKQEMWVEAYKNRITAKTVCSIGAVFDFYAGTIKRAPKWMILFKLEWFYRLISEPKRMWKRYLIYSPLFFWDLLLYLIRLKTD
jgi:N-acetylglucosaminyldiphosphoundecaprenol N-acetyl-beta-D-mannosaminyltransferase